MVINQYEVYLINLDPIIVHEIKKSRPCLIISPNEMNHNISTIIITPMTTKSKNYPTRIGLKFKDKGGWVILDQIRTIDKLRIVKKLGHITQPKIIEIKSILRKMLID